MMDPMEEAEAELGCDPGELAATFPRSIHDAIEPVDDHRYNAAPFCGKCGGPCEMDKA